MEYIEFLRSKMAVSIESGFKVSDDELTPSLFPHVKDTVKWAVSGGQRAIFSSFGMQKTVTQLEILRLIVAHEGGKGLVVCPRRVVVEFVTQAWELYPIALLSWVARESVLNSTMNTGETD